MEIEITSLLEMDCFELSHSRAEGGDNAGTNTWNASKEQAEETPLLDTPEKLEAMRDFAEDSGGWTREEIAEWSDEEINALFLQWIAGDVRQLPRVLDSEFEERDGGWWRTDEDEPDFEIGPFDSRSEAYRDFNGPNAECLSDIDWPEAEIAMSEGQAPSNLFRADDGRIYFYLGN